MTLPYSINAVSTNRSYQLPHSDAPSARFDIERVGNALVAIDVDIKGLLDSVATLFPKTGGTISGDISLSAGAAQRTLKFTSANQAGGVGLYGQNDQFGMYDWQNGRGVWVYRTINNDMLFAAPIKDGSGNAYALQSYVDTKVTALINGAPGILDTLGELAAQLQADESAASALTAAVNGKQAALGFTPVQQGTGVGQSSNTIKLGWSAAFLLKATVDATDLGYFGLFGTASGMMMAPKASMSMSQDAGATMGNFVCRATGTGDENLAGMGFFNDAYAIKLGVRADGTFGLGGWSRAAWSWYSDASGNMTAAGDVVAYSDPRLKENVEVIADPMAILDQLDGVTFNWKTGIPHIECKAGKRDYGVLADQVEAVMPEAVAESIALDGETYRMVAYDKLVPVLLEAVKALSARVKELEARA